MDLATLQQMLSAFPGLRVVCVGDVMVDRYVFGEAARLSPEAPPVPVLARSHETATLGAAGNVARNVAVLGGEAVLVGLVGNDDEGREARRLARGEPGVVEALIADPTRPTTLKTRFMSGGRQLLRVDREETRPAGGEAARRLAATLREAARGADAILVSDYGKGAMTEALIAACRAAGPPVLVDSKAPSLRRHGAVDLIKPNVAELARATGLPTGDDAEIEAALAAALNLSQARAILVTRAAKGMSLAVRGEGARHFAGASREVFDVSGAGDTALAALGLARAGGASFEDAIALAMLAAGVAVTKAGTATVEPDEVIRAAPGAGRAEAKIATGRRLLDAVAAWRAGGLRIGFTNGCFDGLHRGHLACLAQARGWCDRLVVGLNSDRSARALKGEGRPARGLASRTMALGGLAAVDLVAPFDEDTPVELIRAVRPDLLVKGADYAGREIAGADLVEGWGGEVRLADLVEGYSSTQAIARMAERRARARSAAFVV